MIKRNPSSPVAHFQAKEKRFLQKIAVPRICGESLCKNWLQRRLIAGVLESAAIWLPSKQSENRKRSCLSRKYGV
jgi:hypothetical protein